MFQRYSYTNVAYKIYKTLFSIEGQETMLTEHSAYVNTSNTFSFISC